MTSSSALERLIAFSFTSPLQPLPPPLSPSSPLISWEITADSTECKFALFTFRCVGVQLIMAAQSIQTSELTLNNDAIVDFRCSITPIRSITAAHQYHAPTHTHTRAHTHTYTHTHARKHTHASTRTLHTLSRSSFQSLWQVKSGVDPDASSR